MISDMKDKQQSTKIKHVSKVRIMKIEESGE